MTKRPPRCHHDRTTRQRHLDRRHQDDCPNPSTCRGCAPCEEDHCVLCHARHTDDQHPLVCDHCVGAIRNDLNDITALCKQLRTEATTAGNDGRLIAAAPIPGGDAMVMIGPSSDRGTAAIRYESWKAGQLKNSRLYKHYGKDHRIGDPLPPLALLADWEDVWRGYLHTTRAGRASIARSIGFLDRHLTLMAQITDGPDVQVFARDIQTCRARLEGVLHDEDELAELNRGVECFECGVRLVRRIRERKHCRHRTPARAWFATVLTYPELGLPRPTEVAAARVPCESCTQGGVDSPEPGRGWECPGCRKEYSLGEYHNAVRRDLMDSDDGDPWQPITVAAEAATQLAGRPIPVVTVRKWMDRGDIGALCLWEPGKFWGQRMVYWPDVRDRATRPVRITSRRAS